MTYNPGIPLTGTRIDQTYNLITNNFTVLNNQFGLDHYAWTDVTFGGLHKAVHFVNQVADPAPVAAQGIVYTKTGATTELYYEYPTGTVISLTPGGSSHSGFQAWGTFNNFGAGATFLSNSANVASVSYNAGTAVYTVTLSTPLPSANYGIFGSNSLPGTPPGAALYQLSQWTGSGFIQTTTQFQLVFTFVNSSGETHFVPVYVPPTPAIFGTFGIIGA